MRYSWLMIIHLNGWPGAGKKTIGAILASNLGARFIHNHLLHDVAIVVAGFNSPDRWVLYEEVRAAAYASLGKRPPHEVFVMTNALCKNAPREVAAWAHVVDLAIIRDVPLVPIVLEVAPDENVRRVQSAERVGRKLTDADELQSYFRTDVLQYPAVPEPLALDTTRLKPEEAAARIETHIAAIRDSLKPATQAHLRFG